MGVPKFFRWISERYPCLSEVVKEYQVPSLSKYEVGSSKVCLRLRSLLPSNHGIFFQIPEFDNLYLDMNGIIHTCSHPNDFDPHFRITEEKIFKDIFHYIEVSLKLFAVKLVQNLN
jgi:5'-3' exoribonuclease 1